MQINPAQAQSGGVVGLGVLGAAAGSEIKKQKTNSGTAMQKKNPTQKTSAQKKK